MSSFELGHTYTRREIHNALGGGGLEEYLPSVDGVVVCACLDRAVNPGAPAVVLPGFGPRIEWSARQFASQGTNVPTFLKQRSNAWEYVGDYRVKRLSEDEAEVAKWAGQAGREDEVSMVLFLERPPRPL